MNRKWNVLVIEPGKKPYAKEIDATLEALQHEVGGDIQVVYPYADAVGLVVADEGKLNGYKLNRVLRDEDGDIYDIVAGTFLVIGLSEQSFASLPSDLMEKYTTLFQTPEMFRKVGDKLIVISMSEKGRNFS